MNSKDTKQIFLGQGSEPLTDELISELVEKGMPKDDLLYLKEIGAQYNREKRLHYNAHLKLKWDNGIFSNRQIKETIHNLFLPASNVPVNQNGMIQTYPLKAPLTASWSVGGGIFLDSTHPSTQTNVDAPIIFSLLNIRSPF